MITSEDLKKLCEQTELGKAYYRPFICKGDISKVDIFLVGINPATPIFPSEIDIDEYIKCLLNYNDFIELYNRMRINQGKYNISKTRRQIDSFIEWLSSKTNKSILETNVIPYPTKDIKELKNELDSIKQRAQDIFYDILMKFTPSLIIIHGKISIETFFEVLKNKKVKFENEINLKSTVYDFEKMVPLTSFFYTNNKKCTIVACRHFVNSGSKSETFKDFKKRIEMILKN